MASRTSQESPIVFVGSSTEGKKYSRAVVRVLRERGIAAVPWWKPGVFAPGQSFLSSALKAVSECNAAVFIATPDIFSTNSRR